MKARLFVDLLASRLRHQRLSATPRSRLTRQFTNNAPGQRKEWGGWWIISLSAPGPPGVGESLAELAAATTSAARSRRVVACRWGSSHAVDLISGSAQKGGPDEPTR